MYSQKGFAHILLLFILIAGLAFAVFLIGQKTNLFTKAFLGGDSVESLTAELVDLNNQVSIRSAQGTDGRTAQMLAVASQRKDKLLEEIEQDPQSFLAKASLANQRQDFPEQIRSFIEEERSLTGQLQQVHGDSFETQETENSYFFSDSSNKTYEVFFADPPEQLVSGEVSIQSLALDDYMVVESTQPGSRYGLQVLLRSSVYATAKTHRALVIPVKYSNEKSEPYSVDQLRKTLFSDDPDSTSSFYKENSYNQFSLEGDIKDWTTIDMTNEDCDKNWDKWGEAALLKLGLTKESIAAAGYQHIFYVFSYNYCRYEGRGSVDTSPGEVWILTSGYNSNIYTHELGHNLGLAHANSLICPGKAIDTYINCKHTYIQNLQGYEYGDPYDVMGVRGRNYHLNAPHKINAGWISDSHITTITTSGTYTITDAVEELARGTQVLKVKNPGTLDDYYISMRKPIGHFDAGLPELVTQGASIHLWQHDYYNATRFLDTNFEDGANSIIDGALSDGRVFTNEENTISITQVSHDDHSVTLAIKLDFPQMPVIPDSGPLPNGGNPPIEGANLECPIGSKPQCYGYSNSQTRTNAACYDTVTKEWKADACITTCGSCGGGVKIPQSSPLTRPLCADECYSDDLRTNVGTNSAGKCDSGTSSTSHFCSATNKDSIQSCGGRDYTCNGSYWVN